MSSLLETINEPADLKKLNQSQLEELAREIRQVIVQTLAQNGGHLAPSLGVVELTLALHLTFDSPQDKIVWDVGHQAYVHKLITGRREQFSTIRQYGGLSGFPKRRESPHDTFETGHSSTSISAALGMVIARDLRKENYQVVAVIGDGAMTGGMAFEALNHAGQLGKNFIVILNDNEMSISHNVGALSTYLTKLRIDPTYHRAKDDVEYVLSRIPRIGKTMVRAAERLKDSVRYLLVPGRIFEDLGFSYFGPIDGHNLELLVDTFKEARACEGPVLIHVLTQKGRGYLPAEKNPEIFHGVGRFDEKTGEILRESSHPTYTEVFGRTLARLGETNEKIVAVTAAMPDGTGLRRFAEKFPNRFFDVGIAEEHAVTLAAGMAAQGMRPVVAIYSTFLQRAYDQILHDVCLPNLPVVFAIDRAGLVGQDGPTHHGVFDLSYLRHMPNMTVMAPRDENELQHMLKTALLHHGPVAVRYPRGEGPGAPLSEEWRQLALGCGEVLREGGDLLILAIGAMVAPSLAAAEILAVAGVEATVVNSRFLKPLDTELLCRLAARTPRVVTVEENVLMGGFGSAVAELFTRKGMYKVRTLSLGIPDRFIEHGDARRL
ncbi:MAG: 1-deoxy-D-xylulose-5-phosphate synthase, partial [Firmicutes bacterium]|nr:1-deoxy-D-xylulose-5-phosphate synthase [Bacillota bacterium]